MNHCPRALPSASILLLWLPALCLATEGAAPTRQPSKMLGQQFDINFRPGQSLVSDTVEGASERSNDAETRAYHILGMPLNAFLQAMAQRAGVNYIPTPDVQGTVGSVFYDLDPVSMAKAGAQVNGYRLESLDGVFVVHRNSAMIENQSPQGTFRQRKNDLPTAFSVAAKPSTKPVTSLREEAAHARPTKPQAIATNLHPRKKAPVRRQSSVSAEERKLSSLAKKLAQQQEEEKELFEQERRLRRRLQEEERALEWQRKATEKALREQLVRAKKAAEQAQRLSASE